MSIKFMAFFKNSFLLSGLLLLPLTGWGQLTYSTNTDTTPNTLTVSGYTGSPTAVDIPDSVNGMPVVAIGTDAFSGQSGLANITIGTNVTSIGGGAFRGCSMTSVTLPNSVTDIGGSVFENCANLVNVTLSTNLTNITSYMFNGCTSLANITIPDPVTSIGASAFYDCYRLTSITIPDAVINIGDHAFFLCYNLTTVTIGSNVTSIGAYAFYNCLGLSTVTFPANVTSIGSYAFVYCSYLSGVYFQGNVPTPNNDTGVFSYTSVTVIYYAPGTTGWDTLPGGIFDGIPVAINYTGPSEFTFITNTDNTTLTLTKYIGSDSSVAIPNAVNGMPVVAITNNVFVNNNNLASVIIPDTVTSIGVDTFSGCSALTNAPLPSYLTSIGGGAFRGCSMTSVTLPDTVTGIGGGSVFENCVNLASVTLPGNLTNITSYMFHGCASLASITFPGAITSVGTHAFDSCSSLASVYFQGNAPTPNNDATVFQSTPLTVIHYLSGTTGWDTLPNGKFDGIPVAVYTASDYTDPSLFTYTTNAGALTVTGYKGADTDIAIPDSYGGMPVVAIGDSAFNYYGNLTRVIIPDSVTSIYGNAFGYCTSLTSIIIPNNVTNIGNNAFQYCASLTNVTLGNSVTSIGGSAFYNCNLTSVTIPNSVTSIGGSAFRSCTGLTSVYFRGNAPQPDNDTSVFFGTSPTGYYLTGTTGWDTLTVAGYFDGIPVKAYGTPALKISLSSSDHFPHVFIPSDGTNYTLQVTTNLITGDWITVTNGVSVNDYVRGTWQADTNNGVSGNDYIITNQLPSAFFRLK